jgi:hypothetical protein
VKKQAIPPNPIFLVAAKIIASRPAMFLADPFIPGILTNALSENLEKLKNNGLLESYQFKVERLSRLTYCLEVHVSVSKQETRKIVLRYINQLVEPLVKNFV